MNSPSMMNCPCARLITLSCLRCAQPMRLIRRTQRFGGLPDLFTLNAEHAASRIPRKARIAVIARCPRMNDLFTCPESHLSDEVLFV